MESKRKILLVGAWNSAHVNLRAEWLAEHGWDVYVYTRFGENVNYQHNNIHILSHRRCKNMYIDFLQRVVTCVHVLHRIKPAIVHVFFATLDNAFVIPLTKGPVLVSVLGSDILIKKQTLLNRIDKTLSKWLLKKADCVTAVSARLYNILNDEYHITQNMLLQRYGVDVDLITSLDVDRKSVKERYGIEENDIVIFSPRHMKPIYHIEHVIEIMKYLVRQKNNIKLLLRSCPSDENPDGYFYKVREVIKQYGLGEFISYVDYLEHEEYLKIFFISDFVISMAFSDGSPVAVLEAMACKRAVICSDIPANNEIIKNGTTGIIVENDDPEKLSEQILHLLADKRRYRSMGENAYTFVTEHADFQKEMNRMTSIYQDLMHREEV